MSPVAEAVPGIELEAYQRVVRLLLMNPLVSQVWPNEQALPRIRRWADPLRADFEEVLGYRLEIGANHARLVRTLDDLDMSQPAFTGTNRPFDRTRYAYLCLALAAIGRAGQQISLTELAERVSDAAQQIPSLGFDPNSAPTRSAFVDVIAWLQVRGALTFRDGSARSWGEDPDAGEALYDVDKDVAAAVYRPARVLQHISSVAGLLHRSAAASRDTRRRDANLRARRALVEHAVVYYADVEAEVRNHLRTPGVSADVERLTGLSVERRREGLALVDTSGRASDLRFPGPGISHVALLLAVRIAQQVAEQDELALLPTETAVERTAALAERIDVGLPRAGMWKLIEDLGESDEPPHESGSSIGSSPIRSTNEEEDDGDASSDAARYPLLTEAWLATTLRELDTLYGVSFAAALRSDLDRLLTLTIDRLAALRLVRRVDGGVLALPLIARFRGATVTVRSRSAATAVAAPPTLFDMMDAVIGAETQEDQQ